MSEAATAPVTTASPGTGDMAALIASAVADATAATVREQPRDEMGRFASPDAQAVADAVASVSGEPAPAEPEASEAPAPDAEGEPADGEADASEAPAEPDASIIAAPSFPFTLTDHTGAVVEQVPNLTITFKANGKERTEPLDRLVQFASFGVYNHEREQSIKATQAEADAIRAHAAEVAERAQVREQQLARFLSDPSFREAALAEWEAAQTPEAQARRLADEREAFRREQEMTAIRQQGDQFFGNQIAPALEMIQKALPEVSEQEVAAHFHLYLQRVADNGVVHPSRYAEVSAYIVNELVPWAEQVNASRTSKVTKATAAAQTQVQAAKREVAKVKQSVAKAGRPVGTAPALSTVPAPKPLAANATVDERTQSALDDVLASIRRTG